MFKTFVITIITIMVILISTIVGTWYGLTNKDNKDNKDNNKTSTSTKPYVKIKRDKNIYTDEEENKILEIKKDISKFNLKKLTDMDNFQQGNVIYYQGEIQYKNYYTSHEHENIILIVNDYEITISDRDLMGSNHLELYNYIDKLKVGDMVYIEGYMFATLFRDRVYVDLNIIEKL